MRIIYLCYLDSIHLFSAVTFEHDVTRIAKEFSNGWLTDIFGWNGRLTAVNRFNLKIVLKQSFRKKIQINNEASIFWPYCLKAL